MASKLLSLAAVKAQAAAEKAGAWFENVYGGRFLVRYHRNADYNRRREEFVAEERAALKLKADDELPVAARNRAVVKAMFGTILGDWSDLVGEDGATPLEFNLENALALLLVDVDLADAILEFSIRRGNFVAEKVSQAVSD